MAWTMAPRHRTLQGGIWTWKDPIYLDMMTKRCKPPHFTMLDACYLKHQMQVNYRSLQSHTTDHTYWSQDGPGA